MVAVAESIGAVRPEAPAAKPGPSLMRGSLLAVAAFIFLSNAGAHIALLDRSPAPYWDEGLYTYPAIHYLEGRGFAYQMAPDIPHTEKVWAFHGPLFPWLT